MYKYYIYHNVFGEGVCNLYEWVLPLRPFPSYRFVLPFFFFRPFSSCLPVFLLRLPPSKNKNVKR